REAEISLIAPNFVRVLPGKFQRQVEHRANIQPLRRAKEDSGIINHLSPRRDAFLQHHFTKAAKISQRIMRRGHDGDSILLSFFEPEQYVVDYAGVGVEQQRSFDFVRKRSEKLEFS